MGSESRCNGWFGVTIGIGLSLTLCEPAAGSPAHFVCDGRVVRQYPQEVPPEPQALSVTIDENAGTVTISHYGRETIQSPLRDGLVRFGDDDGAGVLTGSIDRFTGVIEFRWTTHSMEPLMNYQGQCRPARPLF
jgi:hypothetical protein